MLNLSNVVLAPEGPAVCWRGTKGKRPQRVYALKKNYLSWEGGESIEQNEEETENANAQYTERAATMSNAAKGSI